MRVFNVRKMLAPCIALFCASSRKFSQEELVITSKLKLDLVSLQQTIREKRPDVDVEWLETTTSTNRVLSDALDDGRCYRVLGADSQTDGRGRRQRPWISLAGHCLTFSLRLPIYRGAELHHLPSLPLVVGLAVVDAVLSWAALTRRTLEGDLLLKWPNDVLCNRRKVAGILIESKSALIIGIGINVFLPSQLQETLPKKIGLINAIEAGGLLANMSGSDDVSRTEMADLVAKVVLAMLSADQLHRANGLGGSAERWNSLHLFQGKEVFLTDGGQILQQGVVLGIGSQGELLLRDASGHVQRVLSGDLSMREAFGSVNPQA
jgi:BirA family transcriptional regulator, biotin operon repressor / biotin---[acetyl-CoA-carboxylase] ligase